MDIELTKIRFKLEEDAQRKADEINEGAVPSRFCPLIKSKCRSDCVCWEEVTVRRFKSGVNENPVSYGLSGFFCDNAMFNETELSI